MEATSAQDIDIVVYTETVGSGLGRSVSDTAGALQALGARVRFIAPSQDYEPVVSKRIRIPKPIGKFNLKKLLHLAYASFVGATRLIRHARKDMPVLIVCFGAHVPFSLAPLLAARIRRAHVIYRLDDIDQHTFRYPKRLQHIERWFYRYAYRKCDSITVMRESMAELVTNRVGINSSRIFLTRHGSYAYRGIQLQTGEMTDPVLLVFGALRVNKQVIESIAAVQAMRANGSRVRLRIAGAPRREDTEYWKQCEELIAAAPEGIEVRAEFIPEEEMPSVLSGVEAFLCPYNGFTSQSGVTNLALSNGIPLIATAESVPETAVNLGTAWIRVEDAATREDIIQAIEMFLSVPREQRFRDAESARQRLFACADWSEAAKAILQHVRKVHDGDFIATAGVCR